MFIDRLWSLFGYVLYYSVLFLLLPFGLVTDWFQQRKVKRVLAEMAARREANNKVTG